MSFARDARNTTPVRAAKRTEPSLSHLLDIVTDHGLQLKTLRQEQEMLQEEAKALRGALSAAGLWRDKTDDAKHDVSSAGFSSPSADEVLSKLTTPTHSNVSHSSGKKPAQGGYPVRHGHMSATATSAAKAEPAGSNSACSTSAGSECGSSSSISSSIRRSSSSGSVGAVRKKGCAKARPKPDGSERAPDAFTWGEERKTKGTTVTPARQRSQSASREASASTPRGSTRRASSGSPLRRSRPSAPPSLYQAAQPLLEPSPTKEKRAVALNAVARALKDGAPADKWEGPESPLRAAVKARSTDMARLLVEARANPNEKDAKGVCVLHTASFDGLADLCRTLLQARADANAADQHGQTALFFSPVSSVCDVLIEHKANVNALNQKGQSALHLASRAGLTEVLVWLAPRVSRDMVDVRDTHGATAAYYARHAGIPSEFLMKHRLLVAESSPATGERSRRRASSQRESEVQEPGRGRTRQNGWSATSRAPLPPLLEDQQGSEEEGAPIHNGFQHEPKSREPEEDELDKVDDEEELPCSTTVTPVGLEMQREEVVDLDVPAKTCVANEEEKVWLSPRAFGKLPTETCQQDQQEISAQVEDVELSAMNSKEGTGEQPDAEPHVEIQALTEVQISAAGEHGQGDAQECRQEDSGGDHREGPSDPDINDQLQACDLGNEHDGAEHSPTHSASEKDRADKMVTWEEDCGHPGSALCSTPRNDDESQEPTGAGTAALQAEAAADEAAASSVASDTSEAFLDASSPTKPKDGRSSRRERRVSVNQAFLWQFAEPER